MSTLGPDLKEELPVLFLRLRHAVVQDGVKSSSCRPSARGLTALAAPRLRYRPGEAAGDGRGALLVGGGDPDAGGIERRRARAPRPSCWPSGPSPSCSAGPVAGRVGRRHRRGRRVLLAALPEARFLPALRRGNVHGALDLGLAPGLLPGRVTLDDGRDWFAEAWGHACRRPGASTPPASSTGRRRAARIDVLVLLGADPLADFPDRTWPPGPSPAPGPSSPSTCSSPARPAEADVVLPAAGFAEVAGTTTNLEGRVSGSARRSRRRAPPGPTG